MPLQPTLSTRNHADWKSQSELLDIRRDDPADVIAFIEHCSADDLHCLRALHGFTCEIAIFQAILTHPLCDRATALQIFHLCDPYYYEQQSRDGQLAFDQMDEEDRVFIAILDIAHEQLSTRMNWRGKFDCPALIEWQLRPNCAPTGLDRWALPAAVLAPTENQPTQPSISYDYTTIRLNYETWSRRQ